MIEPLLVVRFDIPAPLVSLNERHGRVWGRNRQAWIAAATWAAVCAYPGRGPSARRLPPAVVNIALPIRDRRRRDPINYSLVVKWIVDGFVYAGLWSDDTPDLVDQRTPTLHHGYPTVIATITRKDPA